MTIYRHKYHLQVAYNTLDITQWSNKMPNMKCQRYDVTYKRRGQRFMNLDVENRKRPMDAVHTSPVFQQQSLSEQSKIISVVTSFVTFLQKSCSKKLFCLKKLAIWPKPVHSPFIKNCSNVMRKIFIRLPSHRFRS